MVRGLRDYGTAKWEGGDVKCNHRPPDEAGQTTKPTAGQREHAGRFSGKRCWKCGAKRVDAQLGLEKTPEEYVAKMVEVFREVRRVMRREATLWLNLGDSYAGAGVHSAQHANPGISNVAHRGADVPTPVPPGLKSKDLCGIPWRVAFALQADGWYLRQDIIWAKPNPMPESVTDRCTKSHEYVFLLTKSPHYFFDNEAIKETATGYDGRKDIVMKGSPKYADGFVPGQPAQNIAVRGHVRWQKRKNDGTNYGGDGSGFRDHSGYGNLENPYVRNKRSVWIINSEPHNWERELGMKVDHFATFPEDLIKPMVLAGTSEKGVCPDCGKAWERIIEKGGGSTGKSWHDHSSDLEKGMSQTGKAEAEKMGGEYYVKTLGWQPTCKCGKNPVPAIVLDPFIGSGTVGLVAKKLGRNYIGIELSKVYCEMARKRIGRTPKRLI